MPWFPKGDWKKCTPMNNGKPCKGHSVAGKSATHFKHWGTWYYSLDGVKPPPRRSSGPDPKKLTKRKKWYQ